MSAEVIEFQPRADALTRAERVQVREALVLVEAERKTCPTASFILADSEGPSAHSDKPLTKAEIAAVRAMLADFEQIKYSCPVARRIFER